jgi:hypothetical protein
MRLARNGTWVVPTDFGAPGVYATDRCAKLLKPLHVPHGSEIKSLIAGKQS